MFIAFLPQLLYFPLQCLDQPVILTRLILSQLFALRVTCEKEFQRQRKRIHDLRKVMLDPALGRVPVQLFARVRWV